MNFKKQASTTNVLSPSTKIAKQVRGSMSKMFKENYNLESTIKDKKGG